ncbi:MAG TPA: DUF6112 family protein [Acidimicrobiales bacterium]|jgi:hypothetical protein|nr:DUF6112 family protein [Acidimicrobiales bacterium]
MAVHGAASSVMASASTILSGDWKPHPTLPGTSELQRLAQGLEWIGIAVALIGLLVGAAMWVVGSHSQNFHQSVSGRRAVVTSALAALLIGAGPSLIRLFFDQGQSLH